jgi:hypothetical protein
MWVLMRPEAPAPMFDNLTDDKLRAAHHPHRERQRDTQESQPQGHEMSDSDDFSKLDDPAFLDERSRVREELERTPQNAVSPELAIRYEAMNEEFIRRASAAWEAASE